MQRSLLFPLFALLVVGCAGPETGAAAVPAPPLFTEDERRAVVRYWSAPGRYVVAPSPEVWPAWPERAWIEETRKKLPPADRAPFEAWLKRRQAYEGWRHGGEQGPEPPLPGPPPAAGGAAPAPLYAYERVNITVPGSTWHWSYAPLVAQRRAGVAADPAAAADVAAWETWLSQRIAWDKAKAGGGPDAPPPGPIPPSLREALGEPPALFARVRPTRYTVTFAPEDGAAPFVYTDNIPFPDRYAYYRSANGVVRYGRPVKDYAGEEKKRAEAVFARAGRDAFERNVLQAVSRLEGGFEAVNTYDTGWVSIGFIQFIAAREGGGSLAAVLLQHKASDGRDFQATFRRFGIDVAPEGILVAVDPATGAELRGADAVQKIIDDKRLTAVFERAGSLDGFRLAQVLVARARYWPGDDPVTVPITTVYEQAGGQAAPRALGVFWGAADAEAQAQIALSRQAERQKSDPAYRCWADTRTLTARVSDLVRSEAGMATLMDRKVNRGNIRSIADAAAGLMREHKLLKIETLRYYERALVQAMKYRADFLSDPALSQPKTDAAAASR